MEPDADRSEQLRRHYARAMGIAAGDPDGRVAHAFGAVPRERFLGPPPWQVFAAGGHVEAPTGDLALIYRDVLVALIAGKGINNGQPSLHARCIARLDPQPGETVVHVGAGAGYYSAILAELIGDGIVHVYEIEPELAQRARENLADRPNVRVHCTSAAEGDLPACDILYVSAGATHPPESWLDSLKRDGRLMFPLTPDRGAGAMLLVARCGAESFAAEFVGPVGFIPCVGVRDAETAGALGTAFDKGGWQSVRSLRRGTPPDESCWHAGRGWWLSTNPPTGA